MSRRREEKNPTDETKLAMYRLKWVRESIPWPMCPSTVRVQYAKRILLKNISIYFRYINFRFRATLHICKSYLFFFLFIHKDCCLSKSKRSLSTYAFYSALGSSWTRNFVLQVFRCLCQFSITFQFAWIHFCFWFVKYILFVLCVCFSILWDVLFFFLLINVWKVYKEQ